jgi:ferredoxin-nitrite reductase
MEKPNRIERLKARCTPARFLETLEEIDGETVDEAQRFYLKNYGIYNIKLRPERWMLRLRFDGGSVDPDRLELLAGIAEREGLTLLLTARSQMELHGISARRVLPLWRELHEAGIETFQTLTDNFRAVVTDPLDGFDPAAPFPSAPVVERIREIFLRRPEWLGTIPRKFNTALLSTPFPSFNPWGNDLLFALARREETWGYNLYLGGRFNATAQPADIFCTPEEAPALFEAVARVYRAHGPRGSRAKTRLLHLIEEIGMERMRELVAEEYGRPLSPAGTPEMGSSAHWRAPFPIRRYGCHGEITPEALREAARTASEERLTLRLTPHQELWAFGGEKPKTESPEPSSSPHPTPKTQHLKPNTYAPVTACAGSRYCPLSLWDVKEDLALLPLERLERLGISLGFSGCLKGCGRHYHADLGIIGLRTNLYAETERAARVFLGALQAPEPAPARMLYYSVPLRCLGALLDTILEDFEGSGHASFESFSRSVLAPQSIEALQLWYLARQLWDLDETFREAFRRADESAWLEGVRRLPGFPSHEEIYECVRELSHRVWDLSR